MKDKYPGFSEDSFEGWWAYPNELGLWWSKMTGSEQKVLDYILRHTIGFQKSEDAISYKQFINGVRNCDNGCGIKSTRTLSKAFKGLVHKGFITKTGGRLIGKPIKYCLNYKKSEKALSKVNSRSLKNKEVSSLDTKDTINSNTINNSQYNSDVFDIFERLFSKNIVEIPKENSTSISSTHKTNQLSEEKVIVEF